MRPEGLTQSHPRAQGNQEPDRYHVEGWAHGHVARVTVPAKQMHGELTHVCKTIVSFHDTEGPKEVACGRLRGPKTLVFLPARRGGSLSFDPWPDGLWGWHWGSSHINTQV